MGEHMAQQRKNFPTCAGSALFIRPMSEPDWPTWQPIANRNGKHRWRMPGVQKLQLMDVVSPRGWGRWLGKAEIQADDRARQAAYQASCEAAAAAAIARAAAISAAEVQIVVDTVNIGNAP
jgi:hypothetical protein